MTALIISIIAGLAAVSLLSLIIDNLHFVVRTYRLRSSKIRRPVKLVLLTDLHEKAYGNDNEKIVETIKKISPDAVIVGGDLIVYGTVNGIYERAQKKGQKISDPGTEWMKHSLSLMKRLTPVCPVWFVQGNHELRLEYYEELGVFNERFLEEMERAGVQMLRAGAVDPCREGESGVRLQGLELPMKYYRKFRRTRLSEEEMREFAGSPDRSAYTVLVSHIPAYFPVYARWGSDLSLCGHVHGGLMRLPLVGGVVGTRPSLFPKYSGGQYFVRAVTEGRQHLSSMVLSCGLGSHTLPIRIFNPGELSVIELLPADSEKEGNGSKNGNGKDNGGN